LPVLRVFLVAGAGLKMPLLNGPIVHDAAE
jgi:hypothetical protein